MEVERLLRFLEFAWNLLLLVADSICLAFSNLIPARLKWKKDVRNEIVLITGGGSGFGQLLAVRFARLGGKVVLWDVDEKGCRETVAKVEQEVNEAYKVHYYIVDVSDRVKVYETAHRVQIEVGKVTILVNNAGISHCNGFLDAPDSLIEKVVNVNAMAHFWTLKAFLPNMIENNHGHLVSVVSTAGLMAVRMAGAYSASKHAAIGLMDSLTWDLTEAGTTNIKTTVVCPHFSGTPLYQCQFDGLWTIMEPEVVVDRMMEGILTEKEMVYVPRSSCLFGMWKIMATKKPLFKLGQLIIGDLIFKTIKVKTLFVEQISDKSKNE